MLQYAVRYAHSTSFNSCAMSFHLLVACKMMLKVKLFLTDTLSDGSTNTSPGDSPLHRPNKTTQNAGLSLEDLDLLPSREVTTHNVGKVIFVCIASHSETLV